MRTSIAYNSYTGSGAPFGKLDDNIKLGMPVEEATLEILRAIYHGQNELVIGSMFYQVIHYVMMFVPQWLNDWILAK